MLMSSSTARMLRFDNAGTHKLQKFTELPKEEVSDFLLSFCFPTWHKELKRDRRISPIYVWPHNSERAKDVSMCWVFFRALDNFPSTPYSTTGFLQGNGALAFLGLGLPRSRWEIKPFIYCTVMTPKETPLILERRREKAEDETDRCML